MSPYFFNLSFFSKKYLLGRNDCKVTSKKNKNTQIVHVKSSYRKKSRVKYENFTNAEKQ